jgi:Ti-type conjugative transfer relaxase TraA
MSLEGRYRAGDHPVIPRCTVGKGITGAAQYVLSEGRDPETGKRRRGPANGNSRVAWIGGTGFGFDIENREDADLARRIMEFDALNQASRTRQCEKDCVHLSLGWRPGETPTTEEMEQAAREALNAMGMGNAKALFVIHNDEGYPHLHIVASKINPETGRAYDLKENYLKLSRWAEAYEREHGGVICSRREEANELREAIDKRDASAVLELMTRQRATFTARDLDRVLRKQIKDDFERAQFAARILRHVEIVALSDEAGGAVTRYTTRTVLEAEGHVLRAAQGLDRNRRHRLSDAACGAVLGSDRFSAVTREQASAVRLATEAGGLALIDGQAGTGKSYTMAAIREAYEAAGYRVVGLAPTNAVAQDMQRDGFRHARTIHSELFALNNGRTTWNRRTVVMVDEAAMVDTKLMAMLTAHAYDSGAKLILVGDDRQLSSIDRGGMFSALKDRYGAASLTEVRRQLKKDDRRATEMMAEGNFHDALAGYAERGHIHWAGSPEAARVALVRQWEADSAADPGKTRFVFAYTNVDVDELNRDLRRVRQTRGELGVSTSFETKHGKHDFAEGDRVQFTGTDKSLNIYNGNAGVIHRIEGSRIVVGLDGNGPLLAFDAATFKDFRHGYAGTIYKGQGRTIDQTYLYHSQHWRRAASYVALSRHREKAELFVARQTAGDLNELARQMARRDERRAASQFFHGAEPAGPVRPLTPIELLARLAGRSRERRHRQDRIRSAFVQAAQEELERRKPTDQGRSAIKEKEKGKSRSGDLAPKTKSGRRPYRQMMAEPRRRTSPKDATPDDDSESRAVAKVSSRVDLLALWRRVAAWITSFYRPAPTRPSRGNNRRQYRLLR